MLRCWAARRSFVPGTNLGAWMRTVMQNSFLSGRRRARFHANLPEDAFDRLLGVAEGQGAAVDLRDVKWALGELIPEQRAAILLAAEGLSIEEAAASLAIPAGRSEEQPSEVQSLMRISYAVFCLKKKHIQAVPQD